YLDQRIKGYQRRFAGILRLVEDARGDLSGSVVTEKIPDAAVGLESNLLFQHQLTVHSSGSSTVQGLIQKGHRAPVRRPPFGHQVSNGHRRQGPEFFFNITAALLRLLRLRWIAKCWRRSRRDTVKI